jgi:hypothetical protein
VLVNCHLQAVVEDYVTITPEEIECVLTETLAALGDLEEVEGVFGVEGDI